MARQIDQKCEKLLLLSHDIITHDPKKGKKKFWSGVKNLCKICQLIENYGDENRKNVQKKFFFFTCGNKKFSYSRQLEELCYFMRMCL